MNESISFSRCELKLVTDRVKRLGADIKEASVTWSSMGSGGKMYEFFYDEFHWYGKADNAYDAKARGWESWMEMQKFMASTGALKAQQKQTRKQLAARK
jgi:hypothetical protein